MTADATPVDDQAEAPSSQHTKLLDKLEALGRDVDELTNDESWRAYLDMLRRLHTYSPMNQLLIAFQCPGTRAVAGYKRWQEAGRQVRRKETWVMGSAHIMRPFIGKDPDNPDRRVVRGFGWTTVHPIENTDGPPLPDTGISAVPAAGHESELLAHMMALVPEMLQVEVGIVSSPPGANNDDLFGFANIDERKVTLIDRDGLTDADHLATLIHELAHIEDPLVKNDRREREFVAESTAYVVGTEMGLAVEVPTAEYLRNYGASAEDLLRFAKRIGTCASRIMPVVEAALAAMDRSAEEALVG